MTNPARELHATYQEIRTKLDAAGGKSLNQTLKPMGSIGNRYLVKIARLLTQIDELLTRMESEGMSVALYRRQYPEWFVGLVAFNGGWSSSMSSEGFMPEALLDEIEGFANFLDGKVLALSDKGISNLRDSLRAARELLESDPDLNPALRVYIHRLLAEVQGALDDEAVGASFDMEASVLRLWVAFRAAESSTSDANKSKWRDLWTQFVTNVASGALVQGGAVVTQLMLGQ